MFRVPPPVSPRHATLVERVCYTLPGELFSDDASAMEELGLKTVPVHTIQSLLITILLLGNLMFADLPALDEPACVANLPGLDAMCHLLGAAPDDLAQALTMRELRQA